MPKIIGHTPPWLSHPSPGARIFSDPEAQPPASPSKRQAAKSINQESNQSMPSSNRLIAHRGSEVFTVVGNKIRWADLAKVKDEWEERSHRKSSLSDGSDKKVYRTFKTPVYYQIKSITVSPSGHFLAIATEYSVHVATLPDTSRLHDADESEIKLKTYQVGPTTHVIPEAPLAAVLWHPLAVASHSADCLVTVTTDAAVRLWELERMNHWSFEKPALAIDLRKLADGTSSDQDFEPSGFGWNHGFSADAFDMEAAAACFGGTGTENEDPWSSMTLWTSMMNGDVYALCPLLPSKWKPSVMTIPALTTSAVARLASQSSSADPDEQRAASQRYEWVQELDNESDETFDESIRLRPSNPSAIPRLQGPFELPIELDDDVEVCDVLVIPANLDEEDVFSGEDDFEVVGGSKSLPFTILCLTTTDNKVHVMIELDGVTGQWLPKKGRSSFSAPTWDAGEFILLETKALPGGSSTGSWPSFTIDSACPYTFFVTTNGNILSLSLEDWASRIGGEVSDHGETDSGLSSRLALACQGPICVSQTLLTSEATPLSTAVLFEHVDIGTILLTSSNARAIAAQFDQSSFRTSKLLTNEPHFATSVRGNDLSQSTFRASQSLLQSFAPEPQSNLESPPAREPYAPPRIFYENHMAPVEMLRSKIGLHHRHVLAQSPMQMSPKCLEIMTYAHRAFSVQTAQIERAVAELFRRCERLREDLDDQVEQMTKLASRLQQIRSGNESDEIGGEKATTATHDQQISDRIADAQKRQKELYARYERVRRRAAQVNSGNQPISLPEKSWIEEIQNLSSRVSADEESLLSGADDTLSARLEAVKKLSEQLVADTKRVKQSSSEVGSSKGGDESGRGTPEGKVRTPVDLNTGGISRFRRGGIKEAMDMVEREGAVIDAVRRRLANLGVEV